MFSGSYAPDDVTFLLKPVCLPFTPVAEKERLIQSGKRHYSEMLSAERLPSPAYLRVFHQALEQQQGRFARDLLALAVRIAAARSGPITLVSLARAGTPIGVLLRRALRCHLGRNATHYSISIIRDRGIDTMALRHILQRHSAASVVFVDGWTGKGVIADELCQAVRRFNAENGTALDPGLFAVADLSGTAAVAATSDDYLIPSCVLGCTISGLVSRSVLSDAVIGPGDFHGCVYYREFEADDLSAWFVDRVTAEVARQWPIPSVPLVEPEARTHLRQRSRDFLAEVQVRFGVHDVNHVKPGIGEATRVLLRRVPDLLLLRDPARREVAHLKLLAREKDIRVIVEPGLPYLAAALIKEMDG